MNEELYRESYRWKYKEMVKAIENYITKHEQSNGKKPSEKLLKGFCKLRSIPYPVPNEEEYINRMLELDENQ